MFPENSLRTVLCGALSGLCLAMSLGTAHAAAPNRGSPVIEKYGALRSDGNVGELPDPAVRYKVVFEITRSANDPGAINPALDRLARFVNLLGASGIRPAPGDIIAVIHGPATPVVLTDAAYQERFHHANPDFKLIQALQRAGVSIHVCSYALGNQKIERDAVAPGVNVDLAAMMTLATLQLKGWALITG